MVIIHAFIPRVNVAIPADRPLDPKSKVYRYYCFVGTHRARNPGHAIRAGQADLLSDDQTYLQDDRATRGLQGTVLNSTEKILYLCPRL